VDTCFKNFEMGQTEISYKNEFSHTNLKNAKLSKTILNESGNELFLFRHPNYQKLWRILSKKKYPREQERDGFTLPRPNFLGPNV
jgi:hypothetical protein